MSEEKRAGGSRSTGASVRGGDTAPELSSSAPLRSAHRNNAPPDCALQSGGVSPAHFGHTQKRGSHCPLPTIFSLIPGSLL